MGQNFPQGDGDGRKRRTLLIGGGLVALIFSFIIWWTTHFTLPIGIALYTTDFDPLFTKTISSAKREIYLSIFTLSRPKVIRALNKAAAKGVKVIVAFDDWESRNLPRKLHPAIIREPKRPKGLMHQKLLIVDGERILIGSANMTYESMRMHSNLVVHLQSEELARALRTHSAQHLFNVMGRQVRVWQPPKDKEAFTAIKEAIDGAEKSLRIAMFTWTHPLLTEAVIAAHNRGVAVDVMLDGKSSRGASKKTLAKLQEAGIPVRTSKGPALLHHKIAWIDEETLVCGSTNFTKGAFEKNSEVTMILSPLSERENRKLRSVWD